MERFFIDMSRGTKWTTDEIDFLVMNYGKIGTVELSKNIGRSRRAVKSKARRLGLSMSEEEKSVILKNAMALVPQDGDNNHNWKGGISADNYHYKKLQVSRYPEKVRARKIVGYKIKTGKIKREKCMVCGSDNAHAHHEDYSKPLEIIWLCREHHRVLHGGKH